jgi:hypothetical protein
MSDSGLHQLVHGYDHGHSLLAASTTLAREDLDLVDRLSDLSGTLGTDLEVSPYLTLYPVPSKKFFAVARTWLDDSAPRSGCVLTHTVLVPFDLWATDESPSRFAAVLRRPTREGLADYSVPVASVPKSAEKTSTSEPFGDDFVQRYFGEGLAPIAWFGALDAERAAWCVIRALWPSLRARFACCTLALQPRTLGDRPFDLVFAPPTVVSRFGEFARDHFVEGRVSNKASSSKSWFRAWSKCVFEDEACEICRQARKLSYELEPNPTAIRSVMFFLELRERAGDSPTAALGALDLLSKLVPQSSYAQEEKRVLTAAAVQSIKRLPEIEALELLYLICRRLEEDNFSVADQVLQTEIGGLIEQLIKDNPKQGIIDATSLASRHAEGVPRLFMRGIADAMAELLKSNLIPYSALLEEQRLVEYAIPYRPEIPSLILNSSPPAERGRVLPMVVDWCRTEQASKVMPALRRSLLPEIGPSDATLLEELLRDLKVEEAAELCSLIEERDAFQWGPISDIVGRLVGERYPAEVRLWATTHNWHSYQLAKIVAAGYSSTATGFDEFLTKEISESRNKSLLLAAFIERAYTFSLPSWLASLLEDNRTCWEILLNGISDTIVGNVVIKLVRGGLKRSAIARVPGARRMLGAMSGEGAQGVKEHAIRQLLKDYFEFSYDIGIVREWFEEPWVIVILTNIHADSIRAIFTDQLLKSSKSWNSAWNLIEHIPEVVAVENKNFVQELISVLLLNHPHQWSMDASKSWRHLLSRVSRGQVQIDLCTQALHFALENRQYPLGEIVAETFYPVHETAMGHRPKKSLWFSWGFDPWDQAKDLRHSLVDSFLHSGWPPSDFAWAAREPWLLRKLCQRMLRQWKGSEFLQSAYAGVKKSPNPHSRILEPVLHHIIQHPEELKEEWD